ncbi:ankyrin repeat domain-containing protein [Wolbachia endosymbiont (group A) of Pipizella viduata]|uniref:ankyrin repeat domain-containing protein n=1 Tax=Wolbachia endosymbiont (group A) of Pipizella viduata TaxID=3066154 RepID=UPI003340FFD0
MVEEGKAQVNATDNSGNTPLHWAALNGEKDVVKALLGEGANVDAKDNRGWNPLHLAAENYHLEVMGILLSNGASPVNLVNLYGWNPLHLAVAKGDVQ